VAALDEYRRKRDPAATSEPMPAAREAPAGRPPGSARPGPAGNSFVVQEHHASALHWDFRLERDGVLVSWAVPKGLPTDPAVNRLAVHVEDHPLEYASYEGTIGDGQYGSGAVTIWDSGTYRTEKWTDREVKIVLDGHRVHGRFVLFQTGGKNWMMHRMDSPPDPGWLRLPDRLAPMMATEGSLPRGTGWAYEMHWAGVRALVRVEGGRIDVRNADGDDLARGVPELRALGARLGTTQVLFDGVLVQFGAGKNPLTYLIFDVAHLDGRSLLALAYRERREVLNGLQLAGPTWQVPPVFEGRGREALRVSQQQQLSGVIAKRLSSPYRPGQRSPDWLSVPN
jgi:bifunctional non-homologous end joining protein LigD